MHVYHMVVHTELIFISNDYKLLGKQNKTSISSNSSKHGGKH